MPVTRAGRLLEIEAQRKELEEARKNFIQKLVTENKKHVDISGFTLVRLLGKGAFGSVYKASRGGEIFAIKVQRKDKLRRTTTGIMQALNEAIFLHGCNSLFVAKLEGTWRSAQFVALVMEYAAYGDLKRLLEKGPTTERKILYYMAQAACALEYVHAANLIFCDMKPENCLVFDRGRLKLGDFGIALFATETFRGVIGTPHYMAPEIHRMQPFAESVDWWAYGVTIHKLLLNKYPFSRSDGGMAELRRNLQGPIIDFEGARLSQQAKDLISGLLEKDAAKRLGVGPEGLERLKKHAWFKEVDFSWVQKEDFINPDFDLVEAPGEPCDSDLLHHDAPPEMDPNDADFKGY